MDPEPGEEFFFNGHPSWRSIIDFYIKGLVAAVLAGAIAGVITRISGKSVDAAWVIPTVIVVFIVVLIWGFLKRIRTTYTISNQRLTINIGLLSRDMHQARLERVQNVDTNQSILERMLGIGDVNFDTAGSAEFNFAFKGVAHPQRIVHTVDRAIREMQEAHPHPGL
jgi:uncharacterized membrane protein YdbT with pleckstrin-like domain